MKGKRVFTICNSDLVFNFLDISKVFRVNYKKLDKLIDFDNRLVLKLERTKYGLSLCKCNNKLNIDIVDYLKSNNEFMNQILWAVNTIQKVIKPKSIDLSEITGSELITIENPLMDTDIVVKWTNNQVVNNKLIISVLC